MADMIQRLNSIDHPLLDPYRLLNRTNRTRQDPLFVGEGRLVVERMLQSKFHMESVVLGDQVHQSFVDQLPNSLDVALLPQEEVSRLVGFQFHSGILGCAQRRKIRSLRESTAAIAKDSSTVVVCPFTVLPDNLGMIARLCAGFGADALIVGEKSADPYSRRAIRVSMGNVLQLNVIEPDSIAATLTELVEDFDFHLIAANESAISNPLPMNRPGNRLAIILGNESTGIAPHILELSHQQVAIPMAGATDSLNVANAAAVMLYQFTRVAANE